MAIVEFKKQLGVELKKYKLEDPYQPSDKEDEIGVVNIFELEETKKLYRDAAVKSHPDKDSSNISIFQDIVDSKKNNNFNKFLDSAKKLKIEVKEITYEQIDKIEKELEKIEKEIDEMQKSIEWVWYFESKKNRQQIIDNLIKKIIYEQKKN